jgi:RS4NT (NUC023) domain/S4 domain
VVHCCRCATKDAAWLHTQPKVCRSLNTTLCALCCVRIVWHCLPLQARGPKKHLKRLHAPKHWGLGKLEGIWAPKPSCGPHNGRECLPLIIIVRNRLKYALTKAEANMICMQKLVKVDGKVRTDLNFPAGFMGELCWRAALPLPDQRRECVRIAGTQTAWQRVVVDACGRRQSRCPDSASAPTTHTALQHACSASDDSTATEICAQRAPLQLVARWHTCLCSGH